MAARTWRERRSAAAAPAGSDRLRTYQAVRSRPKTIQLIHIGATQLGLIDSAIPAGDPARDSVYRAWIRDRTGGLESCAACSDAQLEMLLRDLRQSGFLPVPKRPQGRRPKDLPLGDMRTKVEALLTSMALPWGYAEAIVQRQRGLPPGVACPIAATSADDLRGLIAALDREARKRSMLADIDAALLARGQDRAALVAALDLPRGWERRMRDLHRVAAWLE